ncbi:hypothetical protein L9F63_010775, partial [Diploptera punctata]
QLISSRNLVKYNPITGTLIETSLTQILLQHKSFMTVKTIIFLNVIFGRARMIFRTSHFLNVAVHFYMARKMFLTRNLNFLRKSLTAVALLRHAFN